MQSSKTSLIHELNADLSYRWSFVPTEWGYKSSKLSMVVVWKSPLNDGMPYSASWESKHLGRNCWRSGLTIELQKIYPGKWFSQSALPYGHSVSNYKSNWLWS